MIFYQIKFGSYEKGKFSEACDIAETYLSSLIRNGQIFYDIKVIPWQNDVLAYVDAAGSNANHLKYHSKNGLNHLSDVNKYFGQEPIWVLHEDSPPKHNVSWKKATSLFLYTNHVENASPVSHGNREKDIPVYLLPVSDEIRDEIYCWQMRCKHLDQIWFDGDSLEIPAYREMVDLKSELSKEGRHLCSEIETATAIPTYYYIRRFFCYSEQAKEENRPCLGCGKPWTLHNDEINSHFFQFDFRCESCRLVSHLGYHTSNRYARIGELPKKLKTQKKTKS